MKYILYIYIYVYYIYTYYIYILYIYIYILYILYIYIYYIYIQGSHIKHTFSNMLCVYIYIYMYMVFKIKNKHHSTFLTTVFLKNLVHHIWNLFIKFYTELFTIRWCIYFMILEKYIKYLTYILIYHIHIYIYT